jgi:hypothetical protein
MNPNILGPWLELVSGVFALVAGLVTAFWAYTKFVLERGLLPPVQFEVDCKAVGLQRDKVVLEILLHLKNLGTSVLVATNIRVDVLYLDAADEPNLFEDPHKPTFGRLRFARSLREDAVPPGSDRTDAPPAGDLPAHERQKSSGGGRGITVLQYDTFVQSGVDQVYTFVTAVPASTTYVLVWSSFQYAQHPSRFQRYTLILSRRLGLIQYSLEHVREPHTIERVFKIPDGR